MLQKKNWLTMYTVILIGFMLLFATYAFAQGPVEYKPLVGLPGLENMDKNTSLPAYINAVYLTIIGLGALIGVIKIAFAGVKYSLSDVVTDKSAAKHDIYGVLLGLAILLIPFIVLQQIYPGLTNLDVLRGAVKVDLAPLPPTGTTVTPTISSTEFREQAGEFTESEYNLGVYSRPISPSDYSEFAKRCKETNPNSNLIVSNVQNNNNGISYGYSCSK